MGGSKPTNQKLQKQKMEMGRMADIAPPSTALCRYLANIPTVSGATASGSWWAPARTRPALLPLVGAARRLWEQRAAYDMRGHLVVAALREWA
jgi:hypothetical protein